MLGKCNFIPTNTRSTHRLLEQLIPPQRKLIITLPQPTNLKSYQNQAKKPRKIGPITRPYNTVSPLKNKGLKILTLKLKIRRDFIQTLSSHHNLIEKRHRSAVPTKVPSFSTNWYQIRDHQAGRYFPSAENGFSSFQFNR
jgi:hypothetical protein